MKKGELELLAEGFVFLEGPRWRNNRLWVSDMFGQTIYTVNQNGEKDKLADVPNRPSGLNFLADGRLVAVSMTDRKLYTVDGKGGLIEYADLAVLESSHINDSVADAAGNIYVGGLAYDRAAGEESKPGKILRVAADGTVSIAAEDLQFPNGMVITPDGKTLICAETFANRLTAFDRADDGTLSNRRLWAELGEHEPDGICLDAEGAVWLASLSGKQFMRMLEGGEIAQLVKTPGRFAIACNLGGDDGRTLFALTLQGGFADILKRKRKARIEMCRVDVPGAGSP